MNNDHLDAVKQAGDALSVFVVVGALSALLPPIAAIFTIIWTAIRIYETKTVQAFLYGEGVD
jgi:F0F1-type ATP synthase assembly protein I